MCCDQRRFEELHADQVVPADNAFQGDPGQRWGGTYRRDGSVGDDARREQRVDPALGTPSRASRLRIRCGGFFWTTSGWPGAYETGGFSRARAWKRCSVAEMTDASESDPEGVSSEMGGGGV